MAPMPNAMRSFDPRRVGRLECDTWVTYYRREWWKFLRAAVTVTRHAFALSWPATLRGSWLVLRANQLWAPYPDNDPDGARRCMRAFYALVARRHGERFDVAEAARLEVEWWRIHRYLQREEPDGNENALVDALAALYAHVYRVPLADVRLAAQERALAMRHSDRWVAEGCDPASPLVSEERAALVRSYAALLAAVHRP
jgi:signal transduction histidine kinase